MLALRNKEALMYRAKTLLNIQLTYTCHGNRAWRSSRCPTAPHPHPSTNPKQLARPTTRAPCNTTPKQHQPKC